MSTTYRIPTKNLEKFKAKFDKMVRRADRISVGIPAIVSSESKTEKVGTTVSGRDVFEIFEYVEVESNIVTVVGTHKFVASLESVGDANVVKRAPDYRRADLDLSAFYGRTVCDHCNTNRRRNKTYIIETIETGVLNQVGSSCINDFLGADYLRSAEWISDLSFNEFEEASSGGSRWFGYGIEVFVACAAASITERGYWSNARAGDARTDSTSGDVLHALALTKAALIESLRDTSPLLASVAIDGATLPNFDAEECVAFIRTYEGDNEFSHNLRTAASVDVLTANFGYVAFGVADFLKARSEKLTRISEAFGAVGDKVGRKLTKKDKEAGRSNHDARNIVVTNTHPYENTYGGGVIIKMVDTDTGHCFIWFCSGDTQNLTAGSHETIAATVKGHSEYKGWTETVLNRVKVIVDK